MKQYKTILILAALALVLVGSYLFLTLNEGVEQTGLAFSLKNGEEITGIEVQNGYGSFSFTLEGTDWYVTADGHSYRTNGEKMGLMLAALSTLAVDRVLEGAEPEYGLATPQAVVSLKTSQSGSYSFQIGAETASRSGVYLRETDSGRVMVAPTTASAQFTGSLAAYRAKDVFTIQKETIRKLDYFKDGELVVSVQNNGPREWEMTHPFVAPARVIELNELVSAVKKWQVAGYPQGTDYAAMGLESPAQALTLTDGAGNTQTFQFGTTDGGTGTYVRTGGEDEVVTLYTTDLDFSILTPNGLLFVAPLKTSVDQISSISVQTGDLDVTFQVEQTGDGQRITSGGMQVDTESFTSIFFKYMAMNADGRDPGTPDGPPVAELKTVFLDGTTAELILFSRDADTYYMQIDGKTDYYLARDGLDQLVYRIEKALG